MSKTSCDLSRYLRAGCDLFPRAQRGLGLGQIKAARSRRLVISAWTLTEMASVGAIKERTGALDHATRQQALSTFHRFASSNLTLVEIEPADFRTAAVLIESRNEQPARTIDR